MNGPPPALRGFDMVSHRSLCCKRQGSHRRRAAFTGPTLISELKDTNGAERDKLLGTHGLIHVVTKHRDGPLGKRDASASPYRERESLSVINWMNSTKPLEGIRDWIGNSAGYRPSPVCSISAQCEMLQGHIHGPLQATRSCSVAFEADILFPRVFQLMIANMPSFVSFSGPSSLK